MKANRSVGSAWPLVFILAGCAANIVPTGPDTYMMSDTAGWVNYHRAIDTCRSQGKDMMPLATSSHYGSLNTADYPKVFFKCVPVPESSVKGQAASPAPGG